MKRSPIICLEGPSAAGKTSLAGALAITFGASIVPELDASGAPPISSAEPWFTQAHVRRWREALRLSGEAPFVIIDCDPLKGLWYNWMHAGEGWPQIDVVGALYREQFRCGELDFPDLYVFLDATEATLWARRRILPARAAASRSTFVASTATATTSGPFRRQPRRASVSLKRLTGHLSRLGYTP